MDLLNAIADSLNAIEVLRLRNIVGKRVGRVIEISTPSRQLKLAVIYSLLHGDLRKLFDDYRKQNMIVNVYEMVSKIFGDIASEDPYFIERLEHVFKDLVKPWKTERKVSINDLEKAIDAYLNGILDKEGIKNICHKYLRDHTKTVYWLYLVLKTLNKQGKEYR